MIHSIRHIVIFSLGTMLSFCYGQDVTSALDQQPRLILKTRAKKDAVYLRWGVNDKQAWKYGTEYGYIIERATVLRDGAPLVETEKIILTGGPIKPKPLPEWEAFIQENDMGAIAAQAIYGESFSVNNEEESILMKVINESSELEQRFGFSMFAVDQDFEAAQYAGLGYVDTTTKANERYLYNIKLAAPETLIQLKETGLLTGTSEFQELPKPYDFAGYYYNNAFVLIWEYDALVNFYTAYDLERSEDGIEFKKINESPITKLSVTEVSGVSFTDSIPQYGKKYWYRILGRTLFNERSQASDTISVIAFKELLAEPKFTSNDIVSDKEVRLNWAFPKDEAWKLKHFDILRADKAIGPYKIIKEQLGKEARSYNYKALQDINYFKIRARGVADDVQESSPAMIQPIDSIPPAAPTDLIGTIDTLGVVRLSWSNNKELDLKGYTVLRANRPHQEFTRITKEEIGLNSYTDTISIKSFNKKVFYQIIATDLRYNESVPSAVIALERPSTIPPTSPVFSGYELLNDTIQLQWIPSSSEDVVKQVLYREALVNGKGLWEAVFETGDPKVSLYLDTNTEQNRTYRYALTALNASGLESAPAPPLSVRTARTVIRAPIKGLYANVNREEKYIELSWRYKEPDVLEIRLFRKGLESEYSLYKVFGPQKKRFLDTKLIPNSTYGYGIKAIFKDGSVSKWNELGVKY